MLATILRLCCSLDERRLYAGRSCVDVADFAAANEDELAAIVDLRHGAPIHAGGGGPKGPQSPASGKSPFLVSFR
jgi:hypothetical protein